MSNNRLIHITGSKGEPLLPVDDRFEPEPGSIVLTSGVYGTAWQRHFRDGLWYRCGGGRGHQWTEILTRRNVVLVYDADQRESMQAVRSNG